MVNLKTAEALGLTAGPVAGLVTIEGGVVSGVIKRSREHVQISVSQRTGPIFWIFCPEIRSGPGQGNYARPDAISIKGAGTGRAA
jgi:hypothetical protein